MSIDRRIDKAAIVNRAPDDVFKMWTTNEGAESFFAPKADIKLEINGSYELLFILENEYGSQGSEGCKILSYLPGKMLSFNWNAPPEFPEIRTERTIVVILFEKIDDNKTKIYLTHWGFGEGGEWNKVYDYFIKAWDIVLNRLTDAVDNDPVNWNK